MTHALHQTHEIRVVGERLVELEHGEFRVVTCRHAFVPEVAIELVDTFEAADDKALEVKLRCDTQVQIHVESVVMRDEWARDRPTWNGLHHRRLDFEKIERIEKIAQVLDDPRARQEHTAALWVDDQIYVALPIARLLIDQPVPLVGQGTQRLGQQSQGFHSDGQLASLRLEEHALCAEDIANVPVLELFVDLPERLGLQEELYLTAAVHELGEAGLAHDPFHHHPPAHLDADRVLVKPLGVAIAVGGQELVCKRIAPKIVRIRL